MNQYANHKDVDAFTPDNLIAGEYPRVALKATITGGAYKLGTVLGKITADGKYTMVTAAASDGSQTPEAILAEDVETNDQEAIIYLSGEFNKNALTIGDGLDLDDLFDKFREKDIFLRTNQGA